MEDFQEVQGRREKTATSGRGAQPKKYMPKQGGRGGNKQSDSDVEMREPKNTQRRDQPKRGAAPTKETTTNGAAEEEKKAGAADAKPTDRAERAERGRGAKGASVSKDTQRSHRVSKEEGFTGDKETWFDGKSLLPILMHACR